MKFLSLLVVPFVLSTNVFASNVQFSMVCKGKNHVASIGANGSRAQVYDLKNEPVMFGALKCTRIFTMEVRPEGSPIVSCRTAAPVADAGLGLYVYRPHGTKKYIGRLTSQSIMGPHIIDMMNCSMRMMD